MNIKPVLLSTVLTLPFYCQSAFAGFTLMCNENELILDKISIPRKELTPTPKREEFEDHIKEQLLKKHPHLKDVIEAPKNTPAPKEEEYKGPIKEQLLKKYPQLNDVTDLVFNGPFNYGELNRLLSICKQARTIDLRNLTIYSNGRPLLIQETAEVPNEEARRFFYQRIWEFDVTATAAFITLAPVYLEYYLPDKLTLSYADLNEKVLGDNGFNRLMNPKRTVNSRKVDRTVTITGIVTPDEIRKSSRNEKGGCNIPKDMWPSIVDTIDQQYRRLQDLRKYADDPENKFALVELKKESVKGQKGPNQN